MFGPPPSGHSSTCSVHHQYSGRVSPFHAYTGTPAGASTVPFGPTATAAAAWSWVEKMLHEAHRTWAPSATRVSISTAVCTVMCSEPVIRAPRSGWAWANSRRIAIRPGISCSASWISLRPNAASDKSATLKSPSATVWGRVDAGTVLVIDHSPDWISGAGRKVETHYRCRCPRIAHGVAASVWTLHSGPTTPCFPPVWFPRALPRCGHAISRDNAAWVQRDTPYWQCQGDPEKSGHLPLVGPV